MNVGVLASGAGTNLQAILDRLHRRPGAGGGVPEGAADPLVAVVAVASDQPGAPALERAARAGVPTGEFPLPAYAGRAERDAAIAAFLAAREVELVVLAGYMALLTPGFLARFPQRVINVHPALLPAFPGLHAIEQGLDYGVKVFGVTVHFVDDGVDTGPVIAQRAVDLPDATGAAEVREALRPHEHDLLTSVIAAFARGAVAIDPARPRRVVIGR